MLCLLRPFRNIYVQALGFLCIFEPCEPFLLCPQFIIVLQNFWLMCLKFINPLDHVFNALNAWSLCPMHFGYKYLPWSTISFHPNFQTLSNSLTIFLPQILSSRTLVLAKLPSQRMDVWLVLSYSKFLQILQVWYLPLF